MQAQFCRYCGAPHSQTARFCIKCGCALRPNTILVRHSKIPWILGIVLLSMFAIGLWRFTRPTISNQAQRATQKLPELLIRHITPVPRSNPPERGFATQSVPTVPAQAGVTIHVVDVGQGDGILIQTDDGTTAVIDGGYDNGLMLAYLQGQGITHIDLMIASHPHADHIGGLVEILQTLQVDSVWTSGASHTTATFERFIDAIAEHGVPYNEVQAGDSIQQGDLALTVLRSEANAGDLNDTSLVLKLNYGSFSMLFTGDAESSSEAALLKNHSAALQATVLKVGHHGSYTSSNPEFVAAVHPEIAVYSAGRNNSYGHPHEKTLQTLCGAGIRVYGTDQAGTIIIHSAGDGYDIQTTLNSHERCGGR